MSIKDIQAALAERDPETLVGPLLFLFTRQACHRDRGTARALAEHLTALALHPRVATTLRLAAGALAVEHQQEGWHEPRT